MYMAPEQLHNAPAYQGTAVDVWASGVMLLVMLVRAPTAMRVFRPYQRSDEVASAKIAVRS